MARTKKIIINVDHVSKNFRLPHEKVNSLKAGLVGIFRSKNRDVEVQHALKDISFTIRKGEFFGIVGRNGSGKSTLLKILAGIYQPSVGHVTTEGKLVPFIELGVGFNPELTGRENVYLNGAMLGFTEKQVADMYDTIVDFAELRPFMDQKLKNYSSGMQVRLAFSMAIRADADILLIDEVLAVGDADFQRKCFKYFNQLKSTNKTVVFVSHDMGAVREYCDRAVLINDQELVYEGTAGEVAERYLRLMNPGSHANVDVEEKVDRWGDGTFDISSVKCDATQEAIHLSYKATALADCTDPVYGYSIRNEKGDEICGTNTVILGSKPKAIKKGASVDVSWQIDNIFADGTYAIDVAVVYDGQQTVADWRNSVAEFDIKQPRHLPYPINPRTDVVVKD